MPAEEAGMYVSPGPPEAMEEPQDVDMSMSPSEGEGSDYEGNLIPSATSSELAAAANESQDAVQPYVENGDYDPACDRGILFEMCAMVDKIDRMPTCDHCKHEMCELVTRAWDNLIRNDPGLLWTGSPLPRLLQIARGQESNRLEFYTSTNPQGARIDAAMAVKEYCQTEPHDEPTTVERAIDTLFQPGDDVWNLDQCKLWHNLRGFYSIPDAVRGRPIAEFVRTHMQLLNRLAHTPPAAGCTGGECFPVVPRNYLQQDNVGGTSRAALDSALRHMAPTVANIIRDQLDRRGEWPGWLRNEPDLIRVLWIMERTGAFQARMYALRHDRHYQSFETNCRRWIQEWHDARPQRADLRANPSDEMQMLMGLYEGEVTEAWEKSRQGEILDEAVHYLELRLDLPESE
jgi:hypothetical protein